MDLLYSLEGMRSGALDTLFLLVTKLGEEVAVLAVMFLVYWCIDKRAGLRIGVFYFAAGMLNQFLKLVFMVERPFALDGRLSPNEIALEGATGYSFPSGHTTSATALAMGLGLWFKKRWLWVLLSIYVALVAFSRMYLGVHTLLDVSAAIALSVAMGFVAEWVITKLDEPGWARRFFIAALAVSLALGAFAFARVRLQIVPQAQATDAFKTVGAALGLLLGLFLDRRYIRFSVEARLWQQIVKLAFGVVTALLIKEGLKPLLGEGLFMQALRYFAVVIYVVAGYPALFSLLLVRRREKRA